MMEIPIYLNEARGAKYELVWDDTIEFEGETLYRIRAMKNFQTAEGLVRRGDFGGWIWGEDALSQRGECWVAGEAVAAKGSTITDSAYVRDGAEIVSSTLRGDSYVFGDSRVTRCELYGDVVVGDSVISGMRLNRGRLVP
jgi:NDP-sugar pyrophosphorylase family protein